MGTLSRLPFFAGFALLAACASTPPQLSGKFPEVSAAQASTDQFVGTQVRWGGVVTGVRSTDDGTCLEVGRFPLDRYSLRPTKLGIFSGAYGNGGGNGGVVHPDFYADSKWTASPRFLACGEEVKDGAAYRAGAVVTVVGTIEPSQIYEVKHADCVRTGRRRQADYSGTVHANGSDTCVVSLPTLEVTAATAWKQPPNMDHHQDQIFYQAALPASLLPSSPGAY